jgi:hypothetical protein
MKKHWWIIVLLAALVLVFSGCGGAKDDDDDDDKEETRGVKIDGTEAWWVAPGAKNGGDKRKYADNRVPVIGEDDDASYIHIFFKPHGVTSMTDVGFECTITLEYEADFQMGLHLMWQCAFDPYGTWSRTSGDSDYIEMIYPGQEYVFKVRPSDQFPGGNWDDSKKNDKTKLTLSEMNGICIQINMQDAEGFDAGYIHIKDFSYTNTGPGQKFSGPPVKLN